jgi:hypothetical protein
MHAFNVPPRKARVGAGSDFRELGLDGVVDEAVVEAARLKREAAQAETTETEAQ